MTILFMMFFGRWGMSEMNWYGNEYVRQRIEKRERNWIPIIVIFDILLMIIIL